MFWLMIISWYFFCTLKKSILYPIGKDCSKKDQPDWPLAVLARHAQCRPVALLPGYSGGFMAYGVLKSCGKSTRISILCWFPHQHFRCILKMSYLLLRTDVPGMYQYHPVSGWGKLKELTNIRGVVFGLPPCCHHEASATPPSLKDWKNFPFESSTLREIHHFFKGKWLKFFEFMIFLS